MAEVDTKLAATLRQAKSTPMHFAFVAKGASDGTLLAAKIKVPAKQVNEAKAELGGGLIWRGRCFGEEGSLVFEVAKEPPSTLAKQLKTVISRDAGLTLRVEVRVNKGLDEAAEEGGQSADEAADEGGQVPADEAPADEAPAEATPPPAAPPAGGAAAFKEQLLRTRARARGAACDQSRVGQGAADRRWPGRSATGRRRCSISEPKRSSTWME